MKLRPLLLSALLLIATGSYAQNCFTPHAGADSYFLAFLDAIVEDDNYIRWKDYYISDPAFDTACALTIGNEQLVCKKIVSARWNKRKKMPVYKTARWAMPVSWNERKILSNLLDAATITANYYSFNIGTDGVIYYLGSWGRLVSSWCPNQGSLPYRTVKALDTVCLAVTSADTILLHRQLAVCRQLTGEFHQLYPLSYFYPIISYHKKSSDIFSVTLGSSQSRLWLKTLVIDSASFRDFHYDEHPLGDSLAVWRREMFLNGHEDFVSIFLSDTSGMRCRINSNNHLDIILPQKMLNRQILFSATKLPKGCYELTTEGRWISIPDDRYRWWPDILFFIF